MTTIKPLIYGTRAVTEDVKVWNQGYFNITRNLKTLNLVSCFVKLYTAYEH